MRGHQLVRIGTLFMRQVPRLCGHPLHVCHWDGHDHQRRGRPHTRRRCGWSDSPNRLRHLHRDRAGLRAADALPLPTDADLGADSWGLSEYLAPARVTTHHCGVHRSISQ